MAFHRVVPKDSNYTKVYNHAARNKNLSCKAKGIFSYLISLPDDWIFHMSHIVGNFTDGRDSIYNGIKELIEHGYIVKRQIRNKKGRIVRVEYDIYEIPIGGKPLKIRKPTKK